MANYINEYPSGSTENEAFSFIAAAAFSNVAGELRSYMDEGVGYIAGDVDGNGTADFLINLGAVQLDAADILL